jgi:hypothetical protein
MGMPTSASKGRGELWSWLFFCNASLLVFAIHGAVF